MTTAVTVSRIHILSLTLLVAYVMSWTRKIPLSSAPA